MSIFNEPEFKALVRKVKFLRIWSVFRCIYSWVFLLGPMLGLRWAVDNLSVALLWVYMLSMPVLFVLGVVLWVKGTNGIFAPVHAPLNKFVKKPTEARLRRVCAELVASRKDRRWPRPDYDLMRKAHTIAAHNTADISRELYKFYTMILKTCGVAGIE